MEASTHSKTGLRVAGRASIVLYLAAVFLYWLSQYLYLPTLSIYAESKTNDLALVGTILSMYGLWQMLTRFPTGIVADWIGRRKLFSIAGMLLAALGAYLMGSAPGPGQLLVGRAVTGLAAAAWVPMVVGFSALFPPEEAVRASSIISMTAWICQMLGTSLTGTLNALGGYSLAFYIAVGVAIAAAVVMLMVKETPRPPKQPTAAGILSVARRRDVLTPSLLSTMAHYAIWAIAFSFAPILAKDLGASKAAQGWLVTINLAATMTGTFLTGALARRVGDRRLVYVGFAIFAGGILIAALGRSLGLVFACQALTGLAMGLLYPLLMGLSIQQVGDDQRTTAMGVHQSVYALGMFAGPWLSGILANWIGIQPMFWITAAGVLLLGWFGARYLRPTRA